MRTMDDVVFPSRLGRAALFCALLGTACAQPPSPTPDVTPSGGTIKQTPRPTAPSPGPLNSPSIVISSLSPDGASPSPVASPSLPPLAAASLDSDLDAPDNDAIQALLDSAELQALLPSDLIHDGGVILYRLLGSSGPSLDVRPQQGETDRGSVVDEAQVAVPRSEALASAGPPESVGGMPSVPERREIPEPEELNRSREARSGAQIRIRKVQCRPEIAGCRAGDLAEVTVRYVSRGVITFRPKDGVTTQKRRYEEAFQRVLLVQRAADRKNWKLLSVGAIELKSDADAVPWNLQVVRLYEGEAKDPIVTQEMPFGPLPADALPLVRSGQPLRIEAQLSSGTKVPRSLAVFAHLVGVSDRAKVALRDDGKNPDRIANDGIYATRFVIPPGPGIRTLGLELVDGAVFQSPQTPLRGSRTLGISLRVQDIKPPTPPKPPGR